MDQFAENTTTFVKWLESRGAQISPRVELADLRAQSMGRGLRVRQGSSSIEPSEQLFSVPASLYFHAEVSPEVAKLSKKYDLDEWSALIVTMMALKATPEWAPYFGVLPDQFSTPMFWEPAEASRLLAPSGVLHRIGRDAADDLYDELAGTILKETLFTALPSGNTSREAFHRMGSIIMAYAFDVPTGSGPVKEENNSDDAEEDEDEPGQDDGDEDDEDDETHEVATTKVLIPLADMINEGATNANVEFKKGDLATGLTCVSTQVLQSGQQTLLARTPIASSEMLRRFGYVDSSDRSLEAVDISLELVKDCAARSQGVNAVGAKLEQLEEYLGELPDTLELAVEQGEDAQLDYDDELLLIVAALTAPAVKRKFLKNAVSDFAEHETMDADAKALLEQVLSTRREQYGEVSAPESTASAADMAQYVRWSESRALDSLLAGLKAINTKSMPPSKRTKTA